MRITSFQTSEARRLSRLSLTVCMLLLGAIVSFLPALADAQAPGDTFVHLFEWKWTDIAEECEQFLGPNGYTAIQISPPQEHAVVTDPAYPWWQRYQPVSYQIVSRSGTRAEFEDMVVRCHAAGVDIYADAVINHTTGVYGQDGVPGGPPWYGNAGTPFDDYTYPAPTGSANGPDYTYDDFNHCDLTPTDDISNYNNRAQVQTCELVNLADLNTGAEEVQNKIAAYLNDLLSLGVAGFRIDAAKHIAAADLNAILGKLSATNKYGAAPYIFQEVINDNNEPVRDYEYYDPGQTTPDGFPGYANGDVTEFRYSNRLSRIFRSGQLNELQQLGGSDMIPSDAAVTFVDNHDNQRSGDVLMYRDEELYTLANVFMLAWPYGYPKVMSSFEFTQRNQSPPADSNGNTHSIYTAGTPDFTGWAAEHRWTPVANMVQFRKTAGAETVANWWTNGSAQIAFGRGDRAFVAINREIESMLESLQTGLAEGKYCNVIDGNLTPDGNNCTGSSVTVASDGTATFAVYPLGAVAIHVDAKTNPGTPSATIATTFNVEVTPEAGETVYLSGDVAELGNGDQNNAIALAESSPGVWSVTVDLPANTLITYKYLKGADAAGATFEGGNNRLFTTPASGTVARDDVWNAGAVNPYNADIFVRGTMNGWGTAHQMTLENGQFTAVISLDAQEYEFKIASEDWSTADFGAGADGQTTALNTPKVLARQGANLQLRILEAGLYSFTVDPTEPEAPVVTVQKATTATVTIHYRRNAGDYGGWGLHLWNQDPPALDQTELDGVTWENPHPFDGADDFGQYVELSVVDPAATFGFILHKGNEKDQNGVDMFLTPDADGFEIWMIQGSEEKFTSEAEALQAAVGLPDLYVRGTMNDWGTANKMSAAGTEFTAVLPLEAGQVEFKIADENRGQDNFGSDTDPVVTLGTPKVLAHGAGNLQLTVPEDGMYRFTLDAADPSAPVLTVQQAQVAIIHYFRQNGDYDGWGLHLWNFDPPALAQSVVDGMAWDNPRPFDGEDDFGQYAVLELVDPAGTFGFIIHKGDEKDHGGLDMTLTPDTEGSEIWMVQGYTDKFKTKEEALVTAGAVGNLNEAKARWISRHSIAWEVDPASGTPYLYYDPDGAITLEEGLLTAGPNGQEIPLSFSGTIGSGTVNDQKLAYLPYLSDWARVDTSGLAEIKTLLTGALAIGIKNAEGQLIDATSLQTAGVLDDLFAYDDDLGVLVHSGVPTLKLWAPTAQSVRLILFDSPSASAGTLVDMTLDPATGVWTVTGDAGWLNKYYLYEVNVFTFWTGEIAQHPVTDPYSVSLSMNSARSQIVDLADPALKPTGWDDLQKPHLDAPEDIVLYELHIRDFSISDSLVPAGHRGKLMAFTETGSNGMTHLKALADAGLTHLHLLPVFDIATIDENPANRVELDDTMDALCAKPGVADELGSLCTDHAGRVIREVMQEAAAADPASEVPQQIVMALRPFDGFNWGYDPFHYGVPEGSYATDPDGTARIKEFRQMVTALNEIGLRVVMDVVYNHTNAARDHEKSVLDKVVPGYYYRLDDSGNIQNSTCCPDTATEHKMMEKLMLDTLKRWAVQYKVDGFRFDLMGHHTRSNMLNVRAMLDGLSPGADGVDGSKIYIYGEGWKFGSIQTNLPSADDPDDLDDRVAFTQTNSAGTGIGTFNDRIRDMVRGAGFMRPPCAQGFISGMEYDPNGEAGCLIEDTAYTLLNYADNIRTGMAGNLKDYQFTGHEGSTVSGKQVAYFSGAPAGYTTDPQEVINYAEAHDNRTLWDYIQFQAPFETAGRVPPKASLAERVRIQNLGLSLVALGQGVPFFHAGTDMLRSKSADEDSYDYGDWFNRLDFTYKSNNWGVGLPNADKNSGEWDVLRPRLRDAEITPGKADILKAVNHFRELLQIRKSSKLFRLPTAADIGQRVRFLNAESGAEQIPGLIVMMVADSVGEDLDPERDMVLVAVNVTPEEVTFQHDDLIGVEIELHPVQQNSADDVVKNAAFDVNAGAITIPARTAVVYQEPQSGS